MFTSIVHTDANEHQKHADLSGKPGLAAFGARVHDGRMVRRQIDPREKEAALARGRRIRRLREARAIGTNELERAIGKHGGYVARLEGKKPPVSVDPDVLADIARELGTTIEEIVGPSRGGAPSAPPLAQRSDPRTGWRDILITFLEEEEGIDQTAKAALMLVQLGPDDVGGVAWWRERYDYLVDERARTRAQLRERAQRDAGTPLPAPAAPAAKSTPKKRSNG